MKTLHVPKGEGGWSRMEVPWLADGAFLLVACVSFENQEFVNFVVADLPDDAEDLEKKQDRSTARKYADMILNERRHLRSWMIKGWGGLHHCEVVEDRTVYMKDESGELIPIEFNSTTLDEFVDMLPDARVIEIREHAKDMGNYVHYVPPRHPDANALGNS